MQVNIGVHIDHLPNMKIVARVIKRIFENHPQKPERIQLKEKFALNHNGEWVQIPEGEDYPIECLFSMENKDSPMFFMEQSRFFGERQE